MDVGGVVGLEFLVKCVQVDGLWFGKVEVTLNAAVQEDTVDLWMGLHHALRKAWNLVELGNVELDRLGLVLSMLLYKLVEILLSTAGYNNLDVVADELGGERLANAGSGSKDEDLLVDELTGHVVGMWFYSVYLGGGRKIDAR